MLLASDHDDDGDDGDGEGVRADAHDRGPQHDQHPLADPPVRRRHGRRDPLLRHGARVLLLSGDADDDGGDDDDGEDDDDDSHDGGD